MSKLLIPLSFILSIAIFFVSCKPDDDPEPKPEAGKLIFKFDHLVDGVTVQFDTMLYTNAAQNEYQINEIQYFISDVILHKSDGESVLIDAWKDINYVDVDIPSTLTWNVYDDIPTGSYDSISFTFGIPGPKNIPHIFVNPPERYMWWPEFLGGTNGGYHYMKLNGKWLNDTNYLNSFDIHIGVGQIYAGGVVHVDNITEFVQNHFNVSLPGSSFTIARDETREIQIVMNIENWFQTPNIYDHDYWKGYIMQNQDALEHIVENGHDVFSIGYIQ